MLRKLHANPTRAQLDTAYAQGLLRKEVLRDGVYYAGRCRNASVARWNAQAQCFVHWRIKFGARFLESIRHPEDEANFDVFLPTAELALDALALAENEIPDARITQHLAKRGS